MNLKIISILFACMVLCVQRTCAQQYLFTRYTTKDGLVNNRTRFFYQDRQGRLYISTYSGLSVYDGSRFINYTTDNGLVAGMINDVVEMGEDSLWIVPNGTGVHIMVHGVIGDIPLADHNCPVINQILRMRDGRIYAVADQGLYRFTGDRFVHIPLIGRTGKDVSDHLVQALEWHGKLILLTDPFLGDRPLHASLILFDPARGKLYLPGAPMNINYIARAPDSAIFVSTAQGIRRLDEKTLASDSIGLMPVGPVYRAANNVVAGYIFFDHLRNIWLSGAQGVTEIARNGKIRLIGQPNGLPAGATSAIFEDRENNIWFANDQNGVVKLPYQQIEMYPEISPGFTVIDCYAGEQSDSTWFYDGIGHRLLLQTEDGQRMFRGLGDMPSTGRLLAGYDADGFHLWLYADYRIFRLEFPSPGRFRMSRIYRELPDPKNPYPNGFSCALFDGQGGLVLVSDSIGLLTRQGGEWIMKRLSLQYLADQVAIDRFRHIWTVNRANQLFVFERREDGSGLRLLHRWDKELPLSSPRSIAVDHSGHVWIGSRDHGLFRLTFDRFRLVTAKQLTIKEGLSENFVNSLHCDPDNTIWVCTPSGLDRVRFNEADTANANGGFVVDNLTTGNAAYQTTYEVMATRSGIHWARGKSGMLKIARYTEPDTAYRPHVLFSRVLAGTDPVPGNGRSVTLTYDHNTIDVAVGASSFVNETQTRYSYLLEGSSGARWSDPSTESSIHLIDLPPGKYTLRVKARILSGLYRDPEGDYIFIIRPPWWQTWWFRALGVCCLAGLALWLTRSYTRRRLEKQRIAMEKRQAVEKERTRIATDMHDDLGAGLSRIKFLSETIGIRQQRQMPIEEEIEGIRQYSHEMIDKMGEIVWALNEKNDSLSHLLAYTRSYAVEYLMQAGLACEAPPPEQVPAVYVSGEFRRNVYLTIKEALHNIVKHARADRVVIRIEAGKSLTISISDDGIGFARDQVRPFSNGLSNMEKRIREIGGELRIKQEKGTTIWMSVPI